jgi:dTDP-4-dehydrorhamnose reductase
MKVLILGVSGLIGHKLFQVLSTKFETYGTIRRLKKDHPSSLFFKNKNIIEDIDAYDFDRLSQEMHKINPDIILNCIGITKRKKEINIPYKAIYINSLLPHMLADWAKVRKKRVIHFSTDCVFNGKSGNYTEKSLTNSEDVYGRTKALGEINYQHTLTIRSSFIGNELFSHSEILEWFLNQKDSSVQGFTKAMYTGVSTIVLARIIEGIIIHNPNLSGLWQLAIDSPISKFELLRLAKKAFNLDTLIVPDDSVKINLNLNGSRLKKKINCVIPSWDDMMKELASESLTYKN